MKSRLTNTPYLVLFTILIAVTVTSAYALTITLGGNVVITGSTKLDGTLLDASNNAGTNGQLLSSTGSGVDWVTASGSGTLSVVERTSNTINITPGNFGEVDIQCQSGELVTGGGFEVPTGAGFPFIDFSGPEAPNGWGVGVFNNDPCEPGSCSETITVFAVAMCTKITPWIKI